MNASIYFIANGREDRHVIKFISDRNKGIHIDNCFVNFYYSIGYSYDSWWPSHLHCLPGRHYGPNLAARLLAWLTDWLIDWLISSSIGRGCINAKICIFYANLMFGMQKKRSDISNNYVSMCPIWFQDRIVKVSSTNPDWLIDYSTSIFSSFSTIKAKTNNSPSTVLYKNKFGSQNFGN